MQERAGAQRLDRFVDAYAPSFAYALDNDLMMSAYPDRVLVHAGSPESLLELGIGHGTTTRRFSAAVRRHVVVEGSEQIVERFFAENADSPTVVVRSMFEDFETTERFDVIVAGFVLEHVSDPAAILRRFSGMLSPRGSLFVAVPNAESLHRRLAHMAGLLDDVMELGDGDRALGHVRAYTQDTLAAQFAEANLSFDGCEGLYLKPLATGQLASLNLDPRVYGAMVEIGYRYPELCAGILAWGKPR
jgi:trans-aconitate methyltransferase